MEIGAEHERRRAIPVPARLDHLAVGNDCFECELQPGIRTARIDHDVSVPRCVCDVGEAHPELVGYLFSRWVDVDQRDVDTRDAAQEACDAATDHARADDGDTVADDRRGVPQHIDGRFDRAREHGSACRDSIRNRYDGISGYDKRGLVGEKRENDLSR